MLCTSCGAQLPDNFVFCSCCGAKLRSNPNVSQQQPLRAENTAEGMGVDRGARANSAHTVYVQSNIAQAAYGMPCGYGAVKPLKEKRRKRVNKRLLLLPCALLLVAAIVLGITFLLPIFKSDYKQAINNYEKLLSTSKLQYAKQLLPRQLVNAIVVRYYSNADEFWDNYYVASSNLIPIINQYGNITSITLDITGSEKLDETELTRLRGSVQEGFRVFGIDTRDIKAAYHVFIKASVVVRDVESPIATTVEMDVIQYKGRWYVLDYMVETMTKYAVSPPSTDQLSELNKASIKPNPNNAYYCLVTVYAEPGAVLVYETNTGERSEARVTEKGVIVFNVPVDALRPAEPIDGATYIAYPKVFIKGAGGALFPVATESITLDVPPINVNYTTETAVSTTTGLVTISGTIDPIRATVTIDDETVSVNSDGSFSHDVRFESVGTFTVMAEAKLDGYQIHRQEFSITVTTPPIPTPIIQLPWEYGDASFNQRIGNTADIATVYGRVPVGSAVTVASQSSKVSFPTTPTVDRSGTFSLQVRLAETGDYVITIICTSAGGGIGTRDIHIQRAPDNKTYIQGATAMNFSAFSTASPQAYVIQGTIFEILHEGDFMLAYFLLTDGNIIVIEYHNHYDNAESFAVGAVYSRVYGHSLGLNTEGIPQFYVWFIED